MRKKQLDEQKAVVAAARSFGPVGATSSDVLAVLAADDNRAKELLRALSRSSSKLPPSFWERNGSGSGGMLSTLGKVHPLVRQRVPGIPSVIYVARDYIHVAVCRDAAAGRLRVCPLCGASLFEYGVIGGTFDARCRIVPLLKRVLPLAMCSACFRGLWRGNGETSSAHCVQRGSAADVAVFPASCRCDSCRLGAGTTAVAEKMLSDTVVDIVSTFGRTGATSNDVLRCLHACCFRNSRMQSRWRIGIHRDRGPFGRREWRRGRVQARVRSILSRNSSKRIVAVDPKPLQRIARTRHRHIGAGSASDTELAYIAIQHADSENSGQSPRPTSTGTGAASQRPLSGTRGTATEELLLEVVLSPIVRIEVAIRVNADFAQLLLPSEGETVCLVRQYSDLIWLRNALSTAYPTVEVPKLPEDSAPPPAVVVLAMTFIAQHPQLAGSPELRMFLRSSDPQDFANSRSRLASSGSSGMLEGERQLLPKRSANRLVGGGRSRSANQASGTLHRTLRLWGLRRKPGRSASSVLMRSTAISMPTLLPSPSRDAERWKCMERVEGFSSRLVDSMHGVVRQTTKLQRKIASLAAFERQHDGVGDSPAQSPARSPARSAGAVAPPPAPAARDSSAVAPKASKYRNPYFREQVRSERAAAEGSAAAAAAVGGGGLKRPVTTVASPPAAARDDSCQATAVLLTKLQETIAQGVRFELEALGGNGGAAAWPGAAASIIEGHFTDLDSGSAPDASPARVSSTVVALQMIANNERGRLERTRAMWQSILPQLLALQREGEAQRSARARGSAFSTLHANVDAWMSADWLINESLLEFGAHLGNGAFGTVSQGNMGGAPVAIKKFHIDLKGSKHDQLVDDFLSEAHTMSRLPPHPNVVQFIGACVSPDKWGLCLVMEFLPRGDLRTLLFGDAPISFGERMRLAMEVATGVHALHSLTPPMLHRDLKSSNVCIDERMQAKVCDFGLSRFKSKRQEQDKRGADSMPVGTAMWMAPELIAVAQGAATAGDRADPFSEKSDVFAIGILIWQLVARAEPYSGLSLSAIMFQVVSDGLRPVVPCRLGVALASAESTPLPLLPEPVARLMQACWDEDPERRPDLSSVIQDLARWAS